MRIVLAMRRWTLMCEDVRWAVPVGGSCVVKSWANKQLASQGSANLHHLNFRRSQTELEKL